MSVYVYGITRDSAPDLDLPGLRGAPVVTVPAGSLAALCSELDADEITPDENDLWTHQAVLQAALSTTAVIPARFGTMFGRAEDITSALEERAESFEERLDYLNGTIEMGVRVMRLGAPEEVPAETPSDGRSYMMRKLDEQQRGERAREDAEKLWTRIEDALGPQAKEARAKLAPTEGVALAAGFLIERDAVDVFREAAEDIDLDGGLELFVTGPWPPYSFAEPEKQG